MYNGLALILAYNFMGLAVFFSVGPLPLGVIDQGRPVLSAR